MSEPLSAPASDSALAPPTVRPVISVSLPPPKSGRLAVVHDCEVMVDGVNIAPLCQGLTVDINVGAVPKVTLRLIGGGYVCPGLLGDVDPDQLRALALSCGFELVPLAAPVLGGEGPVIETKGFGGPSWSRPRRSILPASTPAESEEIRREHQLDDEDNLVAELQAECRKNRAK